MKKNFFKKLSFVMALAMIVSIIAPAAGAFAATDAHLNATKKYLHLSATTGYNEYDFNIAHKQKGWKYEWTSSDEDVVTVDSVGLATATGVGSAKVSVAITDKEGADVATLDATVVVRDNIKELTDIYMQTEKAPELTKLAVATDYDFGRKFVTVAGSTTKTSAITRWYVDSDKATISAAGVFNATEAGTYKITAVAFQSKDKYNAWVALKDTTSEVNVLVRKTIEVKVVNELKSATQMDLNSVKVKLASPVTDAATEVKLYRLVGTTNVPVAVKAVTAVDATKNNEFVVDAYADFTPEAVYVVAYKDLATVQFTAAKTTRDQVTSMTISTTQVVVGTPKDLLEDVKVFNADGVDITNSSIVTTGNITFSTSSIKAYVSGSSASMFKAGDVADVKATWHSQKYNYTTGAEEGNIELAFSLIAVDPAAVVISTINSWTIASGAADFTKPVHEIYVGESGALNVQANQTNSDTKITTGFTYESANTSVLISDTAGNLYPVQAGSAVVVVYYNAKVYDAVTVVVKAAKAASDIKLDTYGFALSNQTVDNTKTVTAKVLDQYLNETDATTLTVEKVISTQTAPAFDTSVAGQVTFNATGIAAGLYPFKVTLGNFSKIVNVTVNAPSSTAANDITYKIKLGATSVDLAASATDLTKSVTVELWGYAPNGVAVTSAALNAGTYRIKIDAPGTGTDDNASNGTYVLSTAVSGAAIAKQPVGAYTVTAYKTVTISGTPVDIVIDQATFTVTDTQSAPVVAAVNSLVYTKTTLPEIVAECFKITWDGTDITTDAKFAIVSVDVVGSTATNSIFVKSVTVRNYITATSYVEKSVNVGLNVTK